MALNNNREQYIKRAKQFTVYSLVLFFVIFNLVIFCKHTSSNPELVVNYQSPEDRLKDYRNPLLGMLFTNESHQVKILVLSDKTGIYPKANYPKILQDDKQKVVLLKNEKTTQKHIEYLQKIVPQIETKTGFDNIETDALIVWFDDLENPLADFDNIKKIAKEKKLTPQAFDFINYKDINAKKSKKTYYTLSEQAENLNYFIADYKTQLNELIENYANFKTTKNNLNDKASSVAVICNENNSCEEFADFDFDKSVKESISENLAKANKKHPNHKKRVFLLTQLEKQNFKSEQDLLNNLDNTLGIVIKKGLLTGIMLPAYWEFYPEKKEFVKTLKIKSGISPDYWSENIQIYFFKAREI